MNSLKLKLALAVLLIAPLFLTAAAQQNWKNIIDEVEKALLCDSLSRNNASYAHYFKLAPSPAGAYHSAFPFFANSEDQVSDQKITDFENMAGKKIVWAYFSNNWLDRIRFPLEAVQTIHAHGAIPFVRLMSWSRIEQNVSETVYTLQRIIDGMFDRELILWADQARTLPFALLVEFGTEVNGEWFPWNGKYNGAGKTDGYGDPAFPDGPERFRDAYRHIIDLFRSRGVQNVTWFFHVNAQSSPMDGWNQMELYYPGDTYIDWIGVSVYGSQAPGEEWITFREVLDPSYSELAAISVKKPLALLEFGVAEDPKRGSKAEWIRVALQSIREQRYPRFKAICYWHEAWENENSSISDLRINSSPGALAAYRQEIAAPFFLTSALVITLQPPVNSALHRLENNYIFFKEFVNRLTWEANPLNTAALSLFRLYRKPVATDDSAYVMVAETPPTVFTYDDRGLKSGETFIYKLTAVDDEGRESAPALISD
jgi:hypothetical protein